MQIEIEMQLTPRTSFSCLIVRSVSLYILLSYGVKDRQKYALNLKFSHVEYIFVFIFTFVWRRIEKYALLLKWKSFSTRDYNILFSSESSIRNICWIKKWYYYLFFAFAEKLLLFIKFLSLLFMTWNYSIVSLFVYSIGSRLKGFPAI